MALEKEKIYSFSLGRLRDERELDHRDAGEQYYVSFRNC